LQRLLRDQPEVLDPDILIISEEFGGWEDSKRRVDLLAVDRAANLVIIELKRTEDGGHMELQAIRYAAMVSKMTFEKASEIFASYLAARGSQQDSREILLDFLGWDTPDEQRFAEQVRIILASAEFSRELTSAVLWLNEQGLDIRCFRLRPYADGGRIFVDVQQLLPLPEASEYFVNLRDKEAETRQVRQREASWTGIWFVNVGMDRPDHGLFDSPETGAAYPRHWSHCVEYGYLAAGGGRKYSDPLKKLHVGDPVMAYQKGAGYVGYGLVTSTAVPINQFALADGDTLAAVLGQSDYNSDRPQDEWEYAVGVEWKKHFPVANAKTFRGVFANQNIVCKLRDAPTLRFLEEAFQLPRA
jgi:hypothetical protein